MKKFVVLLSTIILTLSINPLFSIAEGQPRLAPECLEKMKHRDEKRNKAIMDNIISSFNLDIDESGYHELTYRDLGAS